MKVAAAASVIALGAVGCGERDAKPAVATTPGADGSIAYEKEVGADKQLFSARPDGTGERRLTRVDGDAVHPDWSPDGKRIVFHIEHKNAKPPYCSIAVMNADGSGSPISQIGGGGATAGRRSVPRGELQGADHHSEERKRVGPSRFGVGGVQAGRDVVRDAEQFVGEDLPGGGGPAGDLVEQRS